MQNLFMRLIEMANMLGLLCGAFATIFLGIKLKNKVIERFGIFAYLLFAFLFSVFFALLIRDFIRYGWAIIPKEF